MASSNRLLRVVKQTIFPWRWVGSRKAAAEYVHRRLDPFTGDAGDDNQAVRQVINLLNYTKSSGAVYDGKRYEAGYQTLTIDGRNIPGQRNPGERLRAVPYDFTGKTVLDIGCNQGGMLFEIADRIRHGVGIDYDNRMINVANRIRSHLGVGNVDFYVFDLENEDLEIIQDFIIDRKVDIVFLLSVCMWIKNWRDVIDFSSQLSDNLLFESNGSDEQQTEQTEYLSLRYRSVRLLQDHSPDDPRQKKRKLYLCAAEG